MTHIQKILAYMHTSDGPVTSASIAGVIKRTTKQAFITLYRMHRNGLLTKKRTNAILLGPYGQKHNGVICLWSLTKEGHARLRAPGKTVKKLKPPRTPTKDKNNATKAKLIRGPLKASECLDRLCDHAPAPKQRGDCPLERPCPHVRCRYHLLFDVVRTNNSDLTSLILNWPDCNLRQMLNTCALDIAERGALSLTEVGKALNISKQRANQIEQIALMKVRKRGLERFRDHSPSYKLSSLARAQEIADE